MAETILIATDGSQHGDRAVEIGAGIAAARGAEVTIVHVLLHRDVSEAERRMAEIEYADAGSGPSPGAGAGELPHARFPLADLLPRAAKDDDAPLRAVGESILDRAARQARDAGVSTVETVLEDGDTVERILAAAEAAGAGMIVTGARGVSDLAGVFLGSVSHTLLNRSPVTCVTVR